MAVHQLSSRISRAVLGSVDQQLSQYPAASIIRAVAQKDKNKVDDETLILADMSEKAIAQLKDTVRQTLKDKMSDDKAEQLAETLATGKWTHDYPLTYEELRTGVSQFRLICRRRFTVSWNCSRNQNKKYHRSNTFPFPRATHLPRPRALGNSSDSDSSPGLLGTLGLWAGQRNFNAESVGEG